MFRDRCVICGKEFEVKYKNQNVCSTECRDIRQIRVKNRWLSKVRKEKDCLGCGKPLSGKGSKFCSCDCELGFLESIGYSRKTLKWLEGMTIRKWEKLQTKELLI